MESVAGLDSEQVAVLGIRSSIGMTEFGAFQLIQLGRNLRGCGVVIHHQLPQVPVPHHTGQVQHADLLGEPGNTVSEAPPSGGSRCRKQTELAVLSKGL